MLKTSFLNPGLKSFSTLLGVTIALAAVVSPAMADETKPSETSEMTDTEEVMTEEKETPAVSEIKDSDTEEAASPEMTDTEEVMTEDKETPAVSEIKDSDIEEAASSEMTDTEEVMTEDKETSEMSEIKDSDTEEAASPEMTDTEEVMTEDKEASEIRKTKGKQSGVEETDASEMAEPEAVETETGEETTAETPETTQVDMNLVETAIAAENFETLVAAVQAAGLVETLSGEGPYTIFAPTDEAFAALGEETLAELLKPENKDKLTKILTYHVVPGMVNSSDLTAGDVKTVEGSAITIELDDAVKANNANVIQADVKATNGVIHVIDQVMLPPESEE